MWRRLKSVRRLQLLRTRSSIEGDVTRTTLPRKTGGRPLSSLPSSNDSDSSVFTGLAPEQCPGFDVEERTLGSLGLPDLRSASRKDLEDYFENGWSLTEVLFSSLRSERAFYEPAAHGLRHPLVFYFGHPAALAINKLRVAGLRREPLRADFERIFETGVDEMRWDDVIEKSSQKWPLFPDVVEYRRRARDVVLDVVRHHPAIDEEEDSQQQMNTARWCLAMICEHERIHLETSSVLIRELDESFVSRPPYWPRDHPSLHHLLDDDEELLRKKDLQFRPYEKRVVSLGKSREEGTYGWDNEYGSRTIAVEPFEATDLVTNGQLLEFVKAGGYADERYWTSEGWQWRSFRNQKWPHFWQPKGPAGFHEYDLRLPFHTIPLPFDLPAEVNAHEATAFANFHNARLLSEAEYRAMRIQDRQFSSSSEDPARLDSKALRRANVNLNLAFGSPSRVEPRQHYGNVWQWCLDSFAALPGFRANFLYDDFSSPCFDGEHSLIHGGSFVSTGNEASQYARFHFRPHFHQHAGVRLARSATLPELTSHDAAPPFANGWVPPSFHQKKKKEEEGPHKYESQAQVAAYLDLHFSSRTTTTEEAPVEDFFHLADAKMFFGGDKTFPQRCAAELTEHARHHKRALDVGCAVGGASFALAAQFENVVAFDASPVFVDVASRLQRGDQVSFERSGTAGRTTPASVQLENLKSNVSFLQGDACDSEFLANLSKFDAVLCANLLCRLPEPRRFVETLPDLLTPGGVVLFASPFSWLPQYTPDRSQWYTPAALSEHLSQLGFSPVAQKEMPLLIRDHARKFQLVLSHATAFRLSP